MAVLAGIIGDENPDFDVLDHITTALAHAGASANVNVEARWLPTPSLKDDVERQLEGFDAVWCGPSGPYRNAPSALRAIRFARERGIPFLGTCAGFQHAAIEYAQNVLGLVEAEHAEANPAAKCAIVARLSVPLFERSGAVLLAPGSRSAGIYGRTEIAERYRCRFGLNPFYLSALHRSGLRVSGVDEEGTVTVLECSDHPFFIGTLFMPERSSRAGSPHPLVCAFVRAAESRATPRMGSVA